ncbi:hypothetical protein FEM48_Zijuj07G0104900 [Ziziphus jujuba var. spinosa]|uniref:Enoyl-CoA delta isomerase 2, peroxisomal-like n=1 Tax=Ziziphus jujuba var. spinosa TaxID=714518 RepID=A0A978V443_ZIZJJ|nr:hypothetical protein FEM48_Zijuj07G0104900 [Ziziphus jujuba var. spinosa]
MGNRFFSNGFDLAWAKSASSKSVAADRLHQMVVSLKSVVGALLSLPMPTIAALPGHTAAGGFLFALCHDYILMRSDRGVLYMSEVDMGLPFPDYFTVAMRSKIGSVLARRDVMLRGMKIKGKEAVRLGILDSARTIGRRARWRLLCAWGRSWHRGSGTVNCRPRLGRGCTRSYVACLDWLPKSLPGVITFTLVPRTNSSNSAILNSIVDFGLIDFDL